MDEKDIIDEYLSRDAYIARKTIKHKVLNEEYPSWVSKMHYDGDFHVHNLSKGYVPYCFGADLLTIFHRGLITRRLRSKPARHLDAACDHIINFFGINQQEWAGAQAFSHVNTLLAPFAEGMAHDEVKQDIQRLIYNLNGPWRYGYQTIFSNFIMDLETPYFYKDQYVIKGGDVLDNTYEDYKDEAEMVHKAFWEVLTEGDAYGNVFSFPIPTINITKDVDWDTEVMDLIIDNTIRRGQSYFFNFIGTGLDPNMYRAMCCLVGDTKIISRGSRGISYKNIKEFSNSEHMDVLVEGEFKPADWFRTTTNVVYKVTFANNQTVIFSENHPHITKRGIVTSDKLILDDWVPFSLKGYEGEGGSYELGKLIGLYVAEGSDKKNGKTFSLNPEEDDIVNFIKKFASDNFGASITISESVSEYGTAINVHVNSRTFKELIDEFVGGNLATNKYLKSKVFKMSKTFRKGLWDGWREGDGSSRNRICTVSEQLKEDACALLSSIGNVGSIIIDNRTSENGKLGDNPLYIVRGYSLTRNKYKDIFEIDKDRMWIKVKSIEKEYGTRSVYDFDMATDEEMFQLANGLITHNCRLNLDMSDFPAGGRWAFEGGTGSLGVVTLNMARVGYLSKDDDEIFERIDDLMDKSKEILLRKEEIVTASRDNLGLMPTATYYDVNFNNFFRTVGMLGFNELFLNYTGDNLTEDMRLAESILDFMRNKTIEMSRETGKRFNLEETPGEGSSWELALKDKAKYKDIITMGSGKDSYYSAMIPASHQELQFSNMISVGDRLLNKFTGGTAFRVNVGENNPDPRGMKKLVRSIAYNTRIPYYDFNVTFSKCSKCGNESKATFDVCPNCGSRDVKTYTRVVGYYRDISNFNPGKMEEYKNRVRYEL